MDPSTDLPTTPNRCQTPVSSTSHFRFLDLPLEIREIIYSKLLIQGKVRVYWLAKHRYRRTDTDQYSHRKSYRFWNGHQRTTYAAQPAQPGNLSKGIDIMLVNHQIRDESIPVLYRRIGLFTDDLDAMSAFLVDRSDYALDNIRDLELHLQRLPWKPIYDFAWLEFFRCVARHMHLRSLTITFLKLTQPHEFPGVKEELTPEFETALMEIRGLRTLEMRMAAPLGMDRQRETEFLEDDNAFLAERMVHLRSVMLRGNGRCGS
ncbi:hypothetical protein MMC12_006459 [Toensbergia leucococca]|nr:hypothetical protein [Toensbergia leucococca]